MNRVTSVKIVVSLRTKYLGTKKGGGRYALRTYALKFGKNTIPTEWANGFPITDIKS